jgi:hypothetical protein
MPLLRPPYYGGWGYPCSQKRINILLDFGFGGKWTVPWIARGTLPILRVAARIKALNAQHVDGSYPLPGRLPGQAGVYKFTQAGTYACRLITGGHAGEWSNHAWPLAIDLNWARNPYHGSTSTWGPHDMPPYVISAFGAEGFDWLERFDPMHFERLQIDALIRPRGVDGPRTYDYTEFLRPKPGGEDELTPDEHDWLAHIHTEMEREAIHHGLDTSEGKPWLENLAKIRAKADRKILGVSTGKPTPVPPDQLP